MDPSNVMRGHARRHSASVYEDARPLQLEAEHAEIPLVEQDRASSEAAAQRVCVRVRVRVCVNLCVCVCACARARSYLCRVRVYACVPD